MPLKPFSYPVPETRFFHAGNSIYKFKFRYGNSTTTANLPSNEEDILQDLEDAVRTVLGNLENLQPFVTKYFTVFPCILCYSV
ncbi:membrane-anchored junction protein isoform X2 [Protopterus annectens]|nr:membrane-anchored junction protein isoform X2 [Protopterus annectens]